MKTEHSNKHQGIRGEVQVARSFAQGENYYCKSF